jgi:hypothetical protein
VNTIIKRLKVFERLDRIEKDLSSSGDLVLAINTALDRVERVLKRERIGSRRPTA